MLNKDKRSILLSMCLGDGSIFYTSNRASASITIDHGRTQRDYIEWKAQMISSITGRNVKVRSGHKGKSIQLAVTMRRFKAWRKFIYPGGKKDIAKILPFIRHPELALAIWLCDDGYIEASLSNGKNYSAAIRIFTCSETLESQDKIQKWLKDVFEVDSKIRWASNKKYGAYPFIKIGCKDSLTIWKQIREFILQFDSMKYKFRYIEQIYQSRILQPQATSVSESSDQKVEDIVAQVLEINKDSIKNCMPIR